MGPHLPRPAHPPARGRGAGRPRRRRRPRPPGRRLGPAHAARRAAAGRRAAEGAGELAGLRRRHFTTATVGVERHGTAGGMSVSVRWQNPSSTTFLPVTLRVEDVERRTILYPRQSIRMTGTAHFVSGDRRRYPEITRTVSADSPSDVVFLNYAVSAPRCHGSDG